MESNSAAPASVKVFVRKCSFCSGSGKETHGRCIFCSGSGRREQTIEVAPDQVDEVVNRLNGTVLVSQKNK